jgi:hypothetical protein
MKNVNQEGLNELSQNELIQTEGGNLFKDAVNAVIDIVNPIIEPAGFHINHWN